AQFKPNLPIEIKKHKGHWEFLKDQLGASQISENSYQVHYNLGMTYRNKGLFNESKREFDECLKLRTDDAHLYLALGEVCIFLGKLDDASKYLQHIYELDFESAQCANALGVVHCLGGDFNKAIEWFQKSLALQTNFAASLNNLGICKSIQKKVGEAIEYFKKAIATGNSDAGFNLGMYYVNEGNYENALKLFSGDTADEYFGKGLVFVEQSKDDEALEFFKKTVSLKPNHAGAYYNIGFIFTKLGKFKEG
ncbi:unnamed protein product, partial [marine sediment metagenome]